MRGVSHASLVIVSRTSNGQGWPPRASSSPTPSRIGATAPRGVAASSRMSSGSAPRATTSAPSRAPSLFGQAQRASRTTAIRSTTPPVGASPLAKVSEQSAARAAYAPASAASPTSRRALGGSLYG